MTKENETRALLCTPIDPDARMATGWPEFLLLRERIMHPQCEVMLVETETGMAVMPGWLLDGSPADFEAVLAPLERRIEKMAYLKMEANSMCWIYDAAAMRGYREAVKAFYAGKIEREDLDAVGHRLSQAQRDAIAFECAPFGAVG